MVERDRPQITIWRVRIAYWVHKATDTHTHTHTRALFVILIAFPLQQWLRERASMLRYTLIACPVLIYRNKFSSNDLSFIVCSFRVYVCVCLGGGGAVFILRGTVCCCNATWIYSDVNYYIAGFAFEEDSLPSRIYFSRN